MDIKAIILAAGQGTRMHSKLPKVIHKIAGKPLIEHVVLLTQALTDQKPVVVIGHGADQVKESLMHLDVNFILQQEQLGTGHAVMMAKEHIAEDETVLVLYGDTPLIDKKTLLDFIDYYHENNLDLSVLSMKVPDPTGYGRVVKEKGKLNKIVEHKDADQNILALDEVNSGIYLMNSNRLLMHMHKIQNNNKQNEFYLTDIVEIFCQQGYNVDAYCIEDYTQMLGINNRVQLAEAEMIMRNRINRELMLSGVTIIDPNNTYVDSGVKVGKDTIIYPGSMIRSNSVIGESCEIGPRTVIENSIIDDEVTVKESQILNSRVGKRTKVGPYAYVRPGSNIGEDVKIGDFVEIKNSNIGNGTKISHLTYVGDGDVGEKVNLGCGVVFVNYDGVKKYRTKVGNDSFVGCNVNLVAPVEVSNDAYVAAGTTVTKDVPEGALAIGREKQKNIDGWVKRKRSRK